MKVAFLMNLPLDENLKRVGSVQAPYILAKALSTLDDVEMYIISCHESVIKDIILNDGPIYLHFLESPRPRLGTKVIRDSLKTKKELKKINPDIIHIHSPRYLFVKHRRARRVLTPHGIGLLGEYETDIRNLDILKLLKINIDFLILESNYVKTLRDRFTWIYLSNLYITTLKREKHVIAISNYIKTKLSPFVNCEIKVIHNPVNDKYFQLKSRDKGKDLLLIASSDPKIKGVDMALHVVNEVKKHVPNVKLRIAGNVERAPDFPFLMKYIDDNSIGNNVTFLGCLDEKELLEEYRSCSLLIITSKVETFSLPAVEALAAGKVVVGTKVGILPEVIIDGKNGFIVDYGDHKRFAQRVVTLLENPSMRREMGRRGKEEALRRFSPEVVANEMKKFYEKILM